MSAEKYMLLKIKPDSGYEEIVKEYYTDHGTFHKGDAGLDLFCLQDLLVPARAYGIKLPLRICIAGYNVVKDYDDDDYSITLVVQQTSVTSTGFYMYPRSSTGLRTPIRLSNSVGIIDAAYRGPLAAIVDNVSDEDYLLKKGERYFQVCAADLSPIRFKLVDSLDTTTRGTGGFGSTGK